MRTHRSHRHHHHDHQSASSECDLLSRFTRQVAEVEAQRLEALTDWAAHLTAHAAGAAKRDGDLTESGSDRETERDTAPVEELLELAEGYPRRTLEPDEVLFRDSESVGELFVLISGALRIEKAGVLIAIVTEPGACVGEMSLLLGVSTTADVVASERSELAVIEDAASLLEGDPHLPLALAQLLASRLQVMTTYLVDLKQQYADHEGGLGMVDVVLGSLMRGSGARSQLGSERDPDPEY